MNQESRVTEEKNEKGYRRLKAYQEAHILALRVYKMTENFPKSELFGLVSQMRRCAVSVAANIVEGYSRGSKKELKHFLFIANGSLAELEYYFELAKDLKYISGDEFNDLDEQRIKTGSLLGGFRRHLNLHDS